MPADDSQKVCFVKPRDVSLLYSNTITQIRMLLLPLRAMETHHLSHRDVGQEERGERYQTRARVLSITPGWRGVDKGGHSPRRCRGLDPSLFAGFTPGYGDRSLWVGLRDVVRRFAIGFTGNRFGSIV